MKSDITNIKTMFTKMISQKHFYSPVWMKSPKAQDTDTVVPRNKTAPPLEGVNSMKISVMWTLKYEFRSPKLYEIIK